MLLFPERKTAKVFFKVIFFLQIWKNFNSLVAVTNTLHSLVLPMRRVNHSLYNPVGMRVKQVSFDKLIGRFVVLLLINPQVLGLESFLNRLGGIEAKQERVELFESGFELCLVLEFASDHVLFVYSELVLRRNDNFAP